MNLFSHRYAKSYEKGDIVDDAPFGKCLSA